METLMEKFTDKNVELVLTGNNILSVYETPFLDFGDTEQRKIVRKLNTFIRAEGPVELFLTLSL